MLLPGHQGWATANGPIQPPSEEELKAERMKADVREKRYARERERPIEEAVRTCMTRMTDAERPAVLARAGNWGSMSWVDRHALLVAMGHIVRDVEIS